MEFKQVIHRAVEIRNKYAQLDLQKYGKNCGTEQVAETCDDKRGLEKY